MALKLKKKNGVFLTALAIHALSLAPVRAQQPNDSTPPPDMDGVIEVVAGEPGDTLPPVNDNWVSRYFIEPDGFNADTTKRMARVAAEVNTALLADSMEVAIKVGYAPGDGTMYTGTALYTGGTFEFNGTWEFTGGGIARFEAGRFVIEPGLFFVDVQVE